MTNHDALLKAAKEFGITVNGKTVVRDFYYLNSPTWITVAFMENGFTIEERNTPAPSTNIDKDESHE